MPLLAEADEEPPLPKGEWKRELRNIFLLALPCIISTCSSQTMVSACGQQEGGADPCSVAGTRSPKMSAGRQHRAPAAPAACLSSGGSVATVSWRPP